MSVQPPEKCLISIVDSFQMLWKNRELIGLLAWTDLKKRYQGSILGLLWSFAQPLTMLAIYSFVFGVIFKSSWQTQAGPGNVSYALILFCGLVVFNIFAECVQRAPSLLPSHPYYVKKVIFPTEVLPVSLLGSVLVHFGVSFCVLLAWTLVSTGHISLSALWIPVILLPFLLFCLGVSWILAALGVFVRDTAFIAALIVPVVFFVTPIVYPASAVPAALATLLKYNIFFYFIEASRAALLFDAPFNSKYWVIALATGLFMYVTGYWLFMKLKQSFADAL